MRIAFIGDMHGRAFHALAAAATLQQRLAPRVDLIIQVGDFGYPVPERSDVFSQRYLAADSAEADLSRLLAATGQRADALRRLRELIGRPIYVVRGNHEDVPWLDGLPVDATRTAAADQFDLFRYVPDGTILDLEGVCIGFLGGVEELPGDAKIDQESYDSLLARAARSVDLLVTHEGPYGSSTGYQGDVHGSQLIAGLLKRLQPSWHVFGHGHQVVGPERLGETTWLGVDALVASAIWHPEARGLKPGCLAVLDTEGGELRHVTDDWLATFPTPLDFDQWAAETL